MPTRYGLPSPSILDAARRDRQQWVDAMNDRLRRDRQNLGNKKRERQIREAALADAAARQSRLANILGFQRGQPAIPQVVRPLPEPFSDQGSDSDANGSNEGGGGVSAPTLEHEELLSGGSDAPTTTPRASRAPGIRTPADENWDERLSPEWKRDHGVSTPGDANWEMSPQRRRMAGIRTPEDPDWERSGGVSAPTNPSALSATTKWSVPQEESAEPDEGEIYRRNVEAKVELLKRVHPEISDEDAYELISSQMGG